MPTWSGIYHVMATPFSEDGALAVRPPTPGLDAATLADLDEVLAAVLDESPMGR